MLKEWVKWNMPYIVMKRLLHDIKTVTSNIILSEVSVAWTYNLAYEAPGDIKIRFYMKLISLYSTI